MFEFPSETELVAYVVIIYFIVNIVDVLLLFIVSKIIFLLQQLGQNRTKLFTFQSQIYILKIISIVFFVFVLALQIRKLAIECNEAVDPDASLEGVFALRNLGTLLAKVNKQYKTSFSTLSTHFADNQVRIFFSLSRKCG